MVGVSWETKRADCTRQVLDCERAGSLNACGWGGNPAWRWRHVRRSLKLLGILLIIVVGFLLLSIFAAGKLETTALEANRFCLEKVGASRPDWQTAVVSASNVADVPLQRIWSVWSNLQDWPSWSGSLVESAHWIRGSDWKEGAEFQQVLHLRFPIGRYASRETVHVVNPGESVAWWNVSRGVRYCHIWTFEALSPTRTRVTNADVFHGLLAGLLKSFFTGAWQRSFQSSVDGLIRKAKAEY